MASPTASSSVRNPRASLALAVALCGAAAVPAAIALSRQTGRIHLLDAAWAIPAGMALSVGALLFARGARGRIRRTLAHASGEGRLRAARWLAGLGICVALSASIAVGFYELLVRLEH
jgi:hypothetical protein